MSTPLDDLSILMIAPSRVLAAVLSRELGDIASVKTISCKTIVEALEKIKEIKPDVVVSSTYYEDGEGTDLVRNMRLDSSLSDVEFMVISSETRFEMLEHMRGAGVTAMLSRPFTEVYLSQAVSGAKGFQHPDVFVQDHKPIESVRVLVVDNSKMSEADLMSSLDELGVGYDRVKFAEGASNAVDKLQAADFDAILCDYNINHEEGEELLKFVRQEARLNQVPIVMISSAPR